MANKFKVINNVVNDNLVGLQFATDGGTPLFTVGNFTIETRYSEKENKNYSQGETSGYITLEDIGETKTEDNFLRKLQNILDTQTSKRTNVIMVNLIACLEN